MVEYVGISLLGYTEGQKNGMRGKQMSKKQHDYDDDGSKILKIRFIDNHFFVKIKSRLAF